ncbi:hypothetical protein ACFYLX_03690 [Pseudarthrobacter enclensis]|uniref:hypothetical protein n=1 Tax=Pseudarthrobacter enclensis TaxID=993070 RepID=UPI0036BBFC8D
MFDAIGAFFSEFQPKDWATSLTAVAALGVSALTAWRNHLFNSAKQLEEQANFIAAWKSYEGSNVLQLTNNGDGKAYSVRLTSPQDPTHILGLSETAAGPLKEGEYMILSFSGVGTYVMYGVPRPGAVTERLTFVVDWVDVYGVPRRQKINNVHPGEGLTDEGQNALYASPMLYKGGEIGASVHQDKALFPKLKKKSLSRVWRDRHSS